MVFSIQVSVQPGFSGRCARFDLLGIPGGADVSREVENLRVATGERAQGTLEAECGMSGLPENTVIAWRGNGGEYSRLARSALRSRTQNMFLAVHPRNQTLPMKGYGPVFTWQAWILPASV